MGTKQFIGTLKQALKAGQLTYADVARGLDMSEGNVKRMFAVERITLDRVEAICRLMDMELSDLFQLYEESRQRLSQLTEEQENELVADTRLLFTAICVRNHLGFDEILQHYNMAETDLIQSLAKLDRITIIDLLPGNRIKLRIAENFRWIPNGPIESHYEKAVQNEFLGSGFESPDNLRLFLTGLLSESSQAIISHRLQSLSSEFNELHRQDRELPLEQRMSVGILIAMREWQFQAFKAYIKEPISKRE
jgi:DNA-binding Xre family transcriptional regulator